MAKARSKKASPIQEEGQESQPRLLEAGALQETAPAQAALAATPEPASEPTDEELRQRLSQELERLVERMQELTPEFTPPPFSPQAVLDLIERSMGRLSPGMLGEALNRLRGSISGEQIDLEAWKDTWYTLNYALEEGGGFLRRRMSGEYQTDEWGFDPELLQVVEPFFNFMYKTYWRVQTSGIENIPQAGRAMLVSNHSGQLPWDGAMVGAAVYNEHPNQRLVRTLYADWFPTLPFFSALFVKLGQVLASEDNGIRLLEGEELVAVYPEGYKGVGKPFRERYNLARFGRGGFVRMALKTGAPIIPVAVVGAEETYISLYKSNLLARLVKFPYFPITPTFPWLGLLGFIPLPTRWYIDFGEPLAMDRYGPQAADNLGLISQLTDQVRNLVQDMLLARLAQRRSVFFG